MTAIGDELHHFGWNACSSCCHDATKKRKYLVMLGLKSSRIYIVDTATDPTAPTIYKVIEPSELHEKANLSAPHTAHCLADGRILVSCLGDRDGQAPGGFLVLDETFNVVGRWAETEKTRFNYDFWYQPFHNVMVSTEWSAPTTFMPGFNPAQVAEGKYGQRIYFWNWKEGKISKEVDLGEDGKIPLEVRFHHNPRSTHGFVAAALSSSLFHWFKPESESDWTVEKVAQIEPVEVAGWPFPVPALITDFVISMDDRFIYLSNWLHGDVRQYDISDPSKPRLTGQVWVGGVIGRKPDVATVRGRALNAGPQMLQLSLDGRRLYVTSSLYSSWDDQFYPDIGKSGSTMLLVDCDPVEGGMKLNEKFLVDFGGMSLAGGRSYRAHETRYPGGDCTSDIWLAN
jgi:selenium-binding protein 1